MLYLKLLELFLVGIFFNKDEYKIGSKNFNPIKLIVMIVLIGNLFFTFLLLIKINNIYKTIEKECPTILEKKKT